MVVEFNRAVPFKPYESAWPADNITACRIPISCLFHREVIL